VKRRIFALASCIACTAQAQQSGVVVTPADADADPSLTLPNIFTARKRAAAVPGGANVVDGDSYREGRVSTLNDALSYSPGVFSASRFGAEEARLSIRGSGLQRTFHLRGIKLMQDGVPLNLADGSGDFQSVEPLQTRYIEVLRGANALQHGSSTLGGAINYASVTGYDNWPFLARGEIGSFGYKRLQATTGAVHGDLDFIATISTFNQDGFRKHAVQDAERATANLGYRFSADLETRFYFSYTNSDSELPGNLTKAQLQANPRQANPANVTGHQKRDIDWYRFSSKTVWRFGASRVEAAAYYNDKMLFHPIFQVLDQKNEDAGLDFRFSNENSVFQRKNIFVIGMQPSRGTIMDDRFVNVGGNRGARTNKLDQVAQNIELYAQNQHYVTDKAVAVVGVQHSRNERRSKDLFVNPGQGDESFERTYRGTSPKVGARYEFTPSVQVFANYSASYEPPSFGELVGGLAPNLVNAQKGRTAEVGTRGTVGGISWDVAVYHARIRDELLTTQVFPAGNNPAPSPQTVNVPRTVHEGLELGTSGRFLKSFEWRQALFVNRFRFDADPAFGDNPLPGLPKSLFKGELVHRWGGGIFAGVNVEHSPQRYAVDMANTLFADKYTVWGAKLGRKIAPHWSWFVEARNLTDEKYAATTGVTRNQLGLDGPQFLPGDGQSFYAGLEWKL
jgi:iron complex outermembrane receptor protein